MPELQAVWSFIVYIGVEEFFIFLAVFVFLVWRLLDPSSKIGSGSSGWGGDDWGGSD